VAAVLAHELATLLDTDPAERLLARRARYRHL
jgi:hypothetical protein